MPRRSSSPVALSAEIEGDRWLSTGLQIYREQLPEQILADGGHFELSPMYHAIVLEDLLDVWNLANAAALELPEFHQEIVSWESLIERMRHWLAAMTHPDGSLSPLQRFDPRSIRHNR